MHKQLLPLAVIATLSACHGNFAPAGPEQHESRSIDVDKSERVRVELKMPLEKSMCAAAPGS
jgi:hypothetical protein